MITVTPEVTGALMIASTVRECRVAPDPKRCLDGIVGELRAVGRAGPVRTAMTAAAVLVEALDVAAAETGCDPDSLWQRVINKILWPDDGQ